MLRNEQYELASLKKTDLISALREAHQEILELQNRLGEYEWLEGALRRRTNELNERLKELECLYAISNSLHVCGNSLDCVLGKIVNIIPTGYQYPCQTTSRLIVAGRTYFSSSFCETPFRQTNAIYAHGKQTGNIEVFVYPSTGHKDRSVFLREEAILLKIAAIWIGFIIEHWADNSASTIGSPIG